MERINFGWLTVWVLSQSQKRFLSGALVKPPRLERGVRAVPRLCILYPGICITTEENHGKPQSG